MEMTPLVAIAVPLVGAFLIAITGKSPNTRESVTLITAFSLLVVVASLVPLAYLPPGAALELVEVLPGMSLAFSVEPLGMIYALIGSALWVLNSIYSIGYMRANYEAAAPKQVERQTRFYICFAIAISSVMGIAFSDNALTLFVFYEVLSLSTIPLVTFDAGDEDPVKRANAVKGGRRYLGILLTTSICFLLPAIIATFVYTGTVDFKPGGVFGDAVASGHMPTWLLGIVFGLFIYGIGKAALMPVHRWLPAAMVAPTPVSALLHAVAVVKAGVFSVTKVTFFLVGADTLRDAMQGGWLIYVAGLSIVVASFIALFQDNLKRRLAYSTVSQLSYITLAAAILTPLSAMAAAIHIAAHAFGKITLFFAAGSIYTASDHLKTEVSQLDGIGRQMPVTMACFTIGAFSMIGLPPTAGFISKLYLLRAAADAEQNFVLGVLILSTLLNAGYFLPIVYRAYFKPAPNKEPVLDHHVAKSHDAHGGHADAHGGHGHGAEANAQDHHQHAHGKWVHGEAPVAILIAMGGTAACCVGMFVYPELFVSLAAELAGRL